MFGKKDNRNIVEKQNDAVMFWQYIGTPVFYIIGVILIFALIIGGFKIKNSIANNKLKKAYLTRVEVFNEYLSNNPKTFTDIKTTWNEDNMFYAKNDKGTFMIRFVDASITEVIFTTNTGFTQELYNK